MSIALNRCTCAGALAAILAVPWLAACSPPISVPMPATPTSAMEPTATVAAEPGPSGSSAAPRPSPADRGSLGTVVASRTTAVNGGSIELVLYRIVRDGGLAHVTFTVRSPDDVMLGSTFGDPMSPGYDASGVTLIDPGHQKLYIVASHGRSCLCTVTGPMNAGERPSIVTAAFAAPPIEVTQLEVHIPHFGVFLGVPVV